MFCRIEDYGVDFDYYSYNPCYPFSRVSAFGGCKNVAVSRYSVLLLNTYLDSGKYNFMNKNTRKNDMLF